MAGEICDEGDGENGTSDGLGIGFFANAEGGFVDRFSSGREEVGELFEEVDGEIETSEEKTATVGIWEEFGEVGGGSLGV